MSRLLGIGIVAALVLVGLLTWAGQQRPPDRYLDAIKARGTLRVGLDPTYPPFESIAAIHASTDDFAGYDPDLARAIASDLGVKVEFRPLALDTQYDALASDQVDMLISALPFIYERQKEVRYSQPYYQAGQVIVVRHGDSTIKSEGDLEGKRVGVELGSNADTEARRLARTTLPTMQVQANYHSASEALDTLVRAEVDAAIVDNTSAQEYLGAHPGVVTVVSPPLTNEPYVVAMPVEAEGLASRVDATIARLKASGELAKMMGLAAP